jgi:hypothetical protein
MSISKLVVYLTAFITTLRISKFNQDKSDSSLLLERMADSDLDNDDHGKVSKVESGGLAL